MYACMYVCMYVHIHIYIYIYIYIYIRRGVPVEPVEPVGPADLREFSWQGSEGARPVHIVGIHAASIPGSRNFEVSPFVRRSSTPSTRESTRVKAPRFPEK